MTITAAPTVTPAVEFVSPDDLVVGDVIDFFGEFHEIERIISTPGPLVDAGLPRERIALADGGAWQMTLVSPLVPVIRGAAGRPAGDRAEIDRIRVITGQRSRPRKAVA